MESSNRLFTWALAVLLLGLLCSASTHTSAAVTERVSVSSDGDQGKGASFSPVTSENGRFVAFVSAAANLVSDDTNASIDVFVHDRQTGTTERVSVSSAGEQGNDDCHNPSISYDGRYVAFSSHATNLVAGDTNAERDTFVRDRNTDTTERVSVSSSELQGNAESTMMTSISADGRFVAFCSAASNLVAGDTNSSVDTFVRDRKDGTTERVSVTSAGAEQDDGSITAVISADGMCVAFTSWATNLVVDDTNDRPDVFVHNRKNGLTERVSVSSDGVQGSSTSEDPSISADGMYVAFSSSSSNLVPNDTNSTGDVFVRNRDKASTERVSLSSSGEEGNSVSFKPSISGDGRHVVYTSYASNLVEYDTNDCRDIFACDRLTGTVERVSVNSAGEQSNEVSNSALISADGAHAVFGSDASNLVPDDDNGTQDVFARETDSVGPSVTIDQAPTQPDPTVNSPVNFRVVFSEPVSDFATGDVTLTGTAGATTATVTGGGTVFTVAVTGMTAGGTVLASVSAGVAHDEAGNPNQASTSADNTVTYDPYPHNVSVSPSVGTLPGGASFSIQTVYSDLGGCADIRRGYLLINDSLGQSNAAFLYYDHVANRVYLKNDANTSWGTGYAPGADIILENSQCSVYVNQVTVIDGINELTVNWRIRLKAAHSAKNLNAYMYVQDIAGLIDGWERMGIYYNVRPQVVSIAPDDEVLPIDTQVWLNSIYSDPNGNDDIQRCYLLVCEGFSQANAVFLYYDKISNRIYLKNDANTSWGTGFAPGTDVTLENSQCIVHIGNSTATADGSEAFVSWSFVLKPSMAGMNLCSWMYVTDAAGLHDGWKKTGTHFTPLAPTADSVTPSSGRVTCGLPQVFTTRYSDLNGHGDIYLCYLQLGQTGSLANAVCVLYDQKQNKVFLRNDAHTSWGTGYAPGTAVDLENSQCTVDVEETTVTPSGSNTLIIDWYITLKPALVGVLLGERMYCRDNELLNSGWRLRGYIRGQ